jgi:putative transcriptional regulator
MEFEHTLRDRFLIAMPDLADDNFFHTVTYICEHNREGAMGIVINRKAELTLGELFSQLGFTTLDPALAVQTVYHGGPVQTEQGFILHSPLGDWEATMAINNEVGLTASKDIIEAIARGEGPEHFLVALGYAGWGAGQLEHELLENTWLSAPASTTILFETPMEQRWTEAAALLGVDLTLLSHEAGHA